MATFDFASSVELTEIARERAEDMMADDLLFRFMPTREVDDELLIWEQGDNFRGLQQLRGIGGAFQRVPDIGSESFIMRPGYYGEYKTLDEMKLIRSRELGQFTGRKSIDTLVSEAQDHLLVRRLNLIKWIGWTLFTTGTFTVSKLPGGVTYSGTYAFQTYNASTWATATTATPLADFRAVGLLGFGRGVSFDSRATAVMNTVTFNNMMANTNAADLGGRRLTGLSPVNTQDALRQVMMGDNLPNIVVYDRGWENDAGTFARFVGNGIVVVFGARDGGENIAEYRYTIGVNGETMAVTSGPFQRIIDRGATQLPRNIDVFDGHAGGPVIAYPGSVVVVDVS